MTGEMYKKADHVHMKSCRINEILSREKNKQNSIKLVILVIGKVLLITLLLVTNGRSNRVLGLVDL